VAKKLYVGNLTYGVTDAELMEVFSTYGNLRSAQVIMDRETGRSKGFAFVEFGNDNEADAAVSGLHGKDFNGRTMTVNEARPKEDRGGGSLEAGRATAGGGGTKHTMGR
jgi:RNA recognition motif-containing protein